MTPVSYILIRFVRIDDAKEKKLNMFSEIYDIIMIVFSLFSARKMWYFWIDLVLF